VEKEEERGERAGREEVEGTGGEEGAGVGCLSKWNLGSSTAGGKLGFGFVPGAGADAEIFFDLSFCFFCLYENLKIALWLLSVVSVGLP